MGGDILDMEQLEREEREKIVQALGRLAFFEKFSLYEKKRIAAHNTHFFTYKAGETIIEEGTKDTAFFVLAAGTVSVVKSGVDHPLATLKAGEFFGEMAFLSNMERTSGVVADEMVLVIRVDQELMGRLGVEIREKVKDKIIDKLVANVASTTQRYQELSQQVKES